MMKRTCSLTGLAGLLTALALTGLAALFRFLTGTPGPLPTPAAGVNGTASPVAVAVFFTRPDDPASASLRGGPDALLAEAIGRAQGSVDVAAYDLNLWSIRDALLAAHRRGVTVRVVAESDNLDRPEFDDLKQAGIPVLGDRREGLMHHKFVVLDGYEVWTGSMNFTLNGAYRNDNNLLRLRSSRLAQDYRTEFEEMFEDDRFGPDSRADTPYPRVSLGGVPVEVYFAPDDHPKVRLLELVRGAQESIFFMAFNFTDDDLAQAILERARAGVRVQGVLEASQVAYSQGNEYPTFRAAGVPVRLDGNPHNMHHKVLIVDERWVVTGSYNFTGSAEERNDENLLIFESPDLAARFLAEFRRVWAQGEER